VEATDTFCPHIKNEDKDNGDFQIVRTIFEDGDVTFQVWMKKGRKRQFPKGVWAIVHKKTIENDVFENEDVKASITK